MINKYPKLPEFNNLERIPVCNLDYFDAYKIVINKQFVYDHFDD